MTNDEFEVLYHTRFRAARGLYCGDPPAMKSLVASGYMVSRGKVSWCPDEYFAITDAGDKALEDERKRRKASAEPLYV